MSWKYDIPRGNELTRIILLFLTGLILTLFPEGTLSLVCYIAAVLCIIMGIRNIRNSYIGKLTMVSHPFSKGIILILAGILMFIIPQAFVSILPVAIGFGLVASGIFQAETALKIRDTGAGYWISAIAGSALIIILGIVAIFRPFDTTVALVRYIGISIIVDALFDIWDSLTLNHVNRMHISE